MGKRDTEGHQRTGDVLVLQERPGPKGISRAQKGILSWKGSIDPNGYGTKGYYIPKWDNYIPKRALFNWKSTCGSKWGFIENHLDDGLWQTAVDVTQVDFLENCLKRHVKLNMRGLITLLQCPFVCLTAGMYECNTNKSYNIYASKAHHINHGRKCTDSCGLPTTQYEPSWPRPRIDRVRHWGKP